MCNKCSVISVSEFKLVNSIIENMSELQDTKHPVKETKAGIERKSPKVTKEKNEWLYFTTSNQHSQKNKASVVQLPIANCSKQSKKHFKIQHLYTSSYKTLSRF